MCVRPAGRPAGIGRPLACARASVLRGSVRLSVSGVGARWSGWRLCASCFLPLSPPGFRVCSCRGLRASSSPVSHSLPSLRTSPRARGPLRARAPRSGTCPLAQVFGSPVRWSRARLCSQAHCVPAGSVPRVASHGRAVRVHGGGTGNARRRLALLSAAGRSRFRYCPQISPSTLCAVRPLNTPRGVLPCRCPRFNQILVFEAVYFEKLGPILSDIGSFSFGAPSTIL